MNNRLVPADALHQFVPAERTGVLASAREETDDGPILAERYAYPDSIPERSSPPLEAHSVVIPLGGWAVVERRLDDEKWTEIKIAPGVSSLRPAKRQLTLRGDGQNLDVLTVRFSPSLLHRIAAENETDPTSIQYRDDAKVQDPVLTRLGQVIRQLMERKEAVSTVVLTSIVESIVTRLFVAHCVKHHEVMGSASLSTETLDRIRAYIRAHLDDDIKVEDLADCANMGVSHFTRLFSRMLGHPPYQYVLRQRVEAAREQLKNTDVPISQIALNVGFSSQSHLTRRFKKVVGTTPGRYRSSVQ